MVAVVLTSTRRFHFAADQCSKPTPIVLANAVEVEFDNSARPEPTPRRRLHVATREVNVKRLDRLGRYEPVCLPVHGHDRPDVRPRHPRAVAKRDQLSLGQRAAKRT